MNPAVQRLANLCQSMVLPLRGRCLCRTVEQLHLCIMQCISTARLAIQTTPTNWYHLCPFADHVPDTFSVVAELCAVIGVPITIGPQATILTTTSNPILSTFGIPTPSSLPPIISSQAHFDSTVTSESSSTPTDAATTSASTGGGGTSQGSVEAATSSASHSSPAATSPAGDSNGSHKSYSSLLGSWISILGATMTWMIAM